MADKKNLLMLLGVAFAVAILATALFYGLVANQFSKAMEVRSETIVVAARDLGPGEVIGEQDVGTVPRHEADPLVEGFRNAADVVGLVVVTPIAQGEVLERRKVASKESAHGAALGIPAGLRAVSVHVADSTGVVELLQPGHRVDVQIVSEVPARGRSRRQVRLRTVLQDLEVLRVEPEPEASEGRPVLPVVTLLATPEEADVLAVADAAARVRLLLRHPLDDEITERGEVQLTSVFRRPPAPRGREQARGSAGGKAASGEVMTAARLPAGE